MACHSLCDPNMAAGHSLLGSICLVAHFHTLPSLTGQGTTCGGAMHNSSELPMYNLADLGLSHLPHAMISARVSPHLASRVAPALRQQCHLCLSYGVPWSSSGMCLLSCLGLTKICPWVRPMFLPVMNKNLVTTLTAGVAGLDNSMFALFSS